MKSRLDQFIKREEAEYLDILLALRETVEARQQGEVEFTHDVHPGKRPSRRDGVARK